MNIPPKSLDHPAFGRCELVPSLVAIKWATSATASTVRSVMSGFALESATAGPQARRPGPARPAHDPTAAGVNHAEALTWASGVLASLPAGGVGAGIALGPGGDVYVTGEAFLGGEVPAPTVDAAADNAEAVGQFLRAVGLGGALGG